MVSAAGKPPQPLLQRFRFRGKKFKEDASQLSQNASIRKRPFVDARNPVQQQEVGLSRIAAVTLRYLVLAAFWAHTHLKQLFVFAVM